MKDDTLITRRRALLTGLSSAAGLVLAGCSDALPPTYGNLLRMGDVLTYRAHRLLLPARSLAREYTHADISSSPAIGTTDPGDPSRSIFDPDSGPIYDRLRHGGFADWRLKIEGSVARPQAFSLADLQQLPSRTQITRHTCEEGWSAIGEWTGVPLRQVLEAAGILPSARFVQFYAYDAIADGIDMLDALHPQTILAYGMNGRELPVPHGAPVRLRVETQMGYKSMKFLQRIVVTDRFDDLGGRGPLQSGWSWYAGI
ncbi:MAG TPA: molybdopterin-dependent oxidoreductase [Acidobacteriota bacterium]|nr:molybdopterin-dependent oxidoreductase [Acidobacteriota bacterium]